MASTNPDTLRIKIKSLQPDAFCQIAKKYGFSDFAIEIVFSKSYCTASMLYSLVHSKRLINSFGYILVLIAIPLFIAAFSDEYLNRKWVLILFLIENYTIKIIHCTSEKIVRISTSPLTPCEEALRHGAPELVIRAVRKDEATRSPAAVFDVAAVAFASSSRICSDRDARTAHRSVSSRRHERFVFRPIHDGIFDSHRPGCPGERHLRHGHPGNFFSRNGPIRDSFRSTAANARWSPNAALHPHDGLFGNRIFHLHGHG